MASDLPHSQLSTLGEMGIKQGIHFGGLCLLPPSYPRRCSSKSEWKKWWWILAIAPDEALAKAELTISFCYKALSAGKTSLG